MSSIQAGMVKSVDTRDLKSLAVKCVPVRVRLPAPNQYNPNQIFPVGDGFGLFVFFGRLEETHSETMLSSGRNPSPEGQRRRNKFGNSRILKAVLGHPQVLIRIVVKKPCCHFSPFPCVSGNGPAGPAAFFFS